MKSFLTVLLLVVSLFTMAQTSTQVIKKSSVLFDTINISKKMPIIIPTKVAEDRNISLNFADSPNRLKDLTPIFTLFGGIILGLMIEYLKNYYRVRKNGRRWKTELNILQVPIKHQMTSIQNFLAGYTLDVYDLPELEHIKFLDGKTFDALNHDDLVKYIERYYIKKDKDVIGFFNTINSFNGCRKYLLV